MIEGLPSNLPGPANVKGQALGGHDWVPLLLCLSSRFNRARPEILDARDRLADQFLLAWVALYPVLLALHAGSGWTTGEWSSRFAIQLAMYGAAVLLFHTRKFIGTQACVHILLGLAVAFLAHQAFRVGPMAPPALIISLAAPLGAGLFLGPGAGWAYALVISALFFLGAYLDTNGWLPAFPHTAGWSTRRVWDFWLSMAVGTPVVGGMFLIVIQGIFRAWEKLVEELERKLEEQAQLQERIIKMERLEAVGRMAGGVAHDVNNLIATILGHIEFMEMDLQPGDPLRAKLDGIRKVGLKSSALMQKLLLFAREQPGRPEVVDFNAWIQEARTLLAPLLGATVQISFHPGAELGKVAMDPAHLDQILVNLVVNARDAMPCGGVLTLETAQVRITEEDCRTRPGAAPGEYAQLAIHDQGIGMDPETQKHIFEPYFTTKGPGRGTGLGLATVHGIIHQAGGFIEVNSHPSAGTTFRVYLPNLGSSGD